MLGNFEEGEVLFKKGLHFALEVHSLYCLGLLELLYGHLLNLKGDGKHAIDCSQKSVRYFEEAQAVFLLGHAWVNLGYGYYLLGEAETAKNYIKKGIEIQTDEGVTLFLSYNFLRLSIVHLESGDLKNAQNYAEEALRLSQRNNEKHWEGHSRIWLGRILAKADTARVANAEEYIHQGINISNELKIRPLPAQGYLFLGELYTETGKREKALENIKKAKGMFKEMGMDYWLAKTQEVLDRL